MQVEFLVIDIEDGLGKKKKNEEKNLFCFVCRMFFVDV